MSSLVTGEAVALDLRPAAVPSRALAFLIDAALQLLVIGVLGIAASFAGGSSEAADAAIGILLLVLGLIVYPVALETLTRGRTPGKAAMGLRVVRDDGGPIGFRQALVRGLAAAFLERPGITVGFGALVCSLLHPSGKRIGDLLAGTVVLRERVAVRGGRVATMPPQLEAWARSLELSALPDDLALQARQFVSRAADLTDAAREDLGGRIVGAVLARTSPPPPPGTPGWAVLAAVLAERRRREQERLGSPVTSGEGFDAPPPRPAAPAAPVPPPVPAAPPPAPSSTGFTLPG